MTFDGTVSVGIPTHSRPVELAEAIRSVLDQGHSPLEVVVGDDGSAGGQVVEQISDARIRHVENRPALGMAQNWNMLLDSMRGGILALLQDDDRWLPGMLARCLPAFDDPDVGVVFSNHLFDSGDRAWPRPSLLVGGTHHGFLREYLRTRPVAVSAALIRPEVWRDVRPLPDTLAADVVLFARAADCGWAFHYVDEPLMAYRVHPQQLSAQPGFRSDTVSAWKALRFSDEVAERLRRELLKESLISRAAAALRGGDSPTASVDLQEAATLGRLGRRGGVLSWLARHSRALSLIRRLGFAR